jgi:hypothetical protein
MRSRVYAAIQKAKWTMSLPLAIIGCGRVIFGVRCSVHPGGVSANCEKLVLYSKLLDILSFVPIVLPISFAVNKRVQARTMPIGCRGCSVRNHSALARISDWSAWNWSNESQRSGISCISLRWTSCWIRTWRCGIKIQPISIIYQRALRKSSEIRPQSAQQLSGYFGMARGRSRTSRRRSAPPVDRDLCPPHKGTRARRRSYPARYPGLPALMRAC